MTLAELCEKAGIVSTTPKQRMWEIENSVRHQALRIGTIYALAIALDIEVSELLPTKEVVAQKANVGAVKNKGTTLSVNGGDGS